MVLRIQYVSYRSSEWRMASHCLHNIRPKNSKYLWTSHVYCCYEKKEKMWMKWNEFYWHPWSLWLFIVRSKFSNNEVDFLFNFILFLISSKVSFKGITYLLWHAWNGFQIWYRLYIYVCRWYIFVLIRLRERNSVWGFTLACADKRKKKRERINISAF